MAAKQPSREQKKGKTDLHSGGKIAGSKVIIGRIKLIFDERVHDIQSFVFNGLIVDRGSLRSPIQSRTAGDSFVLIHRENYPPSPTKPRDAIVPVSPIGLHGLCARDRGITVHI
ncbi:hypothetical protein AKJ16_DCAP11190 [Drosera capensis]